VALCSKIGNRNEDGIGFPSLFVQAYDESWDMSAKKISGISGKLIFWFQIEELCGFKIILFVLMI